MPEDVKLSPCPMCGEKAEVGEYYGESLVFCTGCGVQTRSTRKKDAIAAWNRRAPEPGTSVVRWVRHIGTEETLPPIYHKVLLRDADSFAMIPMRGQGRRGDKWFFEDGTQREIDVGDEWTVWPTPEGEG